jgi:predicted RNA methylase
VTPIPTPESRTTNFSILPRLWRSLRKFGPGIALLRIYVALTDHWFDWRYLVKTCGAASFDGLTVRGSNLEHGNRYEPTRVVLLRWLLKQISPMIPPGSALVDLGCGKGRVLLIGAQAGFRKVKGIEFAHELCEIARENCARFQHRVVPATEFCLYESDVVEYKIEPDDNVFFMFNPFDDHIHRKVIANINASLARHARTVLICYYNPKFREASDQTTGFKSVMDTTRWGYHFSVYSND